MESLHEPKKTPMQQIHDWPTFFEQIKLRPGIWFGDPSLRALEGMLIGLRVAKHLYEIPEEKQLSGFSFPDFEAWAAQRFNPERLTINSFYMARLITDSDAQAFWKWFEWIDAFLFENPS